MFKKLGDLCFAFGPQLFFALLLNADPWLFGSKFRDSSIMFLWIGITPHIGYVIEKQKARFIHFVFFLSGLLGTMVSISCSDRGYNTISEVINASLFQAALMFTGGMILYQWHFRTPPV